MSDPEERLVRRVHEALDASAETLPPGVASRLASARAEALAQRASPRTWGPLGYGALATAAVLLLVLTTGRDGVVDAPAPSLVEVAPTLPAESADLDLAMDLDVVEELEFVAWLALEDAGADAG
ncbi:MAG: DUF3619 family protein [Pseudomonadales bacterium]|jgi:hypothetical protein|nr:DUF3619 family protein [Pseudomonadales bacterium]